jgi:hypothetical protein
LLDQLEVYRSSLGLDSQSEVDLCRLHRELMDDRDPLVCRKYDPEEKDNTVLIVVLVSAMAVVLGLLIFIYIYVDRKRKANGLVWQICKSELRFADPPEVVGRGTFGLVVLAEYRGTQVALKRVLPPKTQLLRRKTPSMIVQTRKILRSTATLKPKVAPRQ